jgi:hypothetical protein
MRRGVQYASIIADAERSPLNVIENDLSAEPGTIESQLLQLALVEISALEFAKAWKNFDWFECCTLSRDLEASIEYLSIDQSRPHIVQIFHHFQLVWRGRVAYINSYIEALCIWFGLMSRPSYPLDAFHLSGRISVEDLAKEIFSEVQYCRENWWPPGTKFGDEAFDSPFEENLPRAPKSNYEF